MLVRCSVGLGIWCLEGSMRRGRMEGTMRRRFWRGRSRSRDSCLEVDCMGMGMGGGGILMIMLDLHLDETAITGANISTCLKEIYP